MESIELWMQIVLSDLRNIYYGLQGIIALKDLEFLGDIEKSLKQLEEKLKSLEDYKEVNILEHLTFVNSLINRLRKEDYDISKGDIDSRLKELDDYLPRSY